MRQRPRSSERSSRASHGGVVGDAAAPAPGDAWSGMVEKLCSGDDVTDDEEPSSWTISLAVPAQAGSVLAWWLALAFVFLARARDGDGDATTAA